MGAVEQLFIQNYTTDKSKEGERTDPFFIIALGYLARKKGMTKVARETGLNRESLYKSLAEGGNPKFSTISKITKALGCKLAVI